jgi:glycosyltransferase involved in cell wall biosynthesis
MRIIVYSETTAATVGGNLGLPEYSYYFILKKYLPVLLKLGEVCYVQDPQREVDELYHEAKTMGTASVFLSFTPPHRTAKALQCPTVCVLAWEFDNIPSDDWDAQEPWQNWVTAIREIGHVITISDYATRVIKRQVGRGPQVVTIPAPVDPVAIVENDKGIQPAGHSPAFRLLPHRPRSLDLTASIFDTEALDIDSESVTPKVLTADEAGNDSRQFWDGHPVYWDFSAGSETSGQYLVGFYGEEEWGSWSKTARPSVIFPWSLRGEIELLIELVGYGANQGRTISLHIGDQVADIVLQPEMQEYRLAFSLTAPANNLYFSGLTAEPEPGARDHRTLGLGLSHLSICRPDGTSENTPATPNQAGDDLAPVATTTLQLTGTVYASVFNPADGRKNWLDIVTAFCWAFREDADKTLVLKMSHHNRSTFLGDLFLMFSRLAPFKCRVIAIHGYLSAEELARLVTVTDFFVNASVAEGQCLPLLEFMAEGVPAISPDHTAMETYINRDNAFVVASSHQPHIWPNDPRESYRTLSNRIDWDSLRQAYCDSAAVLSGEPERYALMAAASRSEVEKNYSSREVEKRLRKFLHKTARPRAWWRLGWK